MLLEQLRNDVVWVCRELAASGLVVGTSGNVSARDGDLVVVSPSGVDYAELTADLVGVHRLDGTPVEAVLRPTTEMPLHLGIYAATGAAAIVHTHSVAATALSTVADELPAIHYQVAMFGGPLAVAPYATYGTDELARNVVTALRDRTACLMANHGALATGKTIDKALAAAAELELLAQQYVLSLAAGGPVLLSDEEVAEAITQFGQVYGPNVPKQA